MNSREYLEKRNALWQKLRELEPDDERVEALMLELMEHTKISREKVLEGLQPPSIQIPILEFDPRPLKQLDQFFPKAQLSVMLPLILDIRFHALAGRRTDRERRVTRLPCKPVVTDFGMHPD